MFETITVKELRKALKGPGRFYVGSNITGEDVTYVQAVKSDLLCQIQGWSDDMTVTVQTVATETYLG